MGGILNRGKDSSVTLKRPLPTINPNQGTTIISVSGESVSLVAGAAGTTGSTITAFGPIYSLLGDRVGDKNDTSLSIVAGALTTEITFEQAVNQWAALEANRGKSSNLNDPTQDFTAGLNNGEYYVIHETGRIFYKKATNATSASVSYKYRSASQSTTQVVGNVADNAANSGNPILIGGVYNLAAQTYSDGDRANLQQDVNGYLKVVEQYMPGYERNSDQLAAIQALPTVSSTYSWTEFKNLGANTKLNIKASAGQLFSAYAFNDNAGIRYLQFFKTATTPSGGQVPDECILLPAASGGVPGIVSIGETILGSNGSYSSSGWAFGYSTTRNSFTDSATASEHSLFAKYK